MATIPDTRRRGDGHADAITRGHLGPTLRRRATRGTALTLMSQWARFLLQLGSTMVLARLLTPSDYGMVGMVMGLSGLAMLLTRMGLSQVTVQRADITHDQVSALFWLNAALGAVATAVVALASPLVADFYGRPELVHITVAFSMTFALDGLTVQHEALLGRTMRYGWLSVIEVVSLGGGAVVALTMAALGGGYWALVGLHLGERLVRLVIVWIGCSWRPSRPRRVADLRSMVSFGADLGAFSLLNYLARHLDNVLIGRVWGAGPLGLYAKAYQLLLLPIQQINVPISRVALPTLSFLQNDPARYRRYYQAAIGAISYVAMPLIVMMAVLSEEIVLLLLGAQWVGAAPIFRVLAFAGLAQSVGHANGWIHVSTGHTRRQLLWGLVSRPIVVLALFVGLPWGPYGVAVAYTVATGLLTIPGFIVAVRDTPLTLHDIVAATWRPAVASAFLFLTMTVLHGTDARGGPLIAALVTAAAGTGVYLACILLPSGMRRDAIGLLRLLRGGLTREPTGPQGPAGCRNV